MAAYRGAQEPAASHMLLMQRVEMHSLPNCQRLCADKAEGCIMHAPAGLAAFEEHARWRQSFKHPMWLLTLTSWWV